MSTHPTFIIGVRFSNCNKERQGSAMRLLRILSNGLEVFSVFCAGNSLHGLIDVPTVGWAHDQTRLGVLVAQKVEQNDSFFLSTLQNLHFWVPRQQNQKKWRAKLHFHELRFEMSTHPTFIIRVRFSIFVIKKGKVLQCDCYGFCRMVWKFLSVFCALGLGQLVTRID